MITTREFGQFEGQPVIEATLDSGKAKVSILNYGCIFRDWQVGGVPVIVGFDTFEAYLENTWCFGILAGRVANRIRRGKFTLNGTDYQLNCNDGANHLHGGTQGLGKRIWDMDTSGDALVLRYHSPAGEENYPGTVDFTITITLEGTKLTMDMRAVTDTETPINLAQHNYYNLNGSGDVLGHTLVVDAESYTETEADLIPTGRILPVANTNLDFREPTPIGAIDPDRKGIDDNLVLREGRDQSQPAAVLSGDQSGLTLKLWTDQPGLQLFNGPILNAGPHGPFCGMCLESQYFPDSVNHPEWASILCTPEKPYAQKLVIDIA